MNREDLNCYHSRQALASYEAGDTETARYHVSQDTGFCGTFEDWKSWFDASAAHRAEMARSMDATSQAWANAG